MEGKLYGRQGRTDYPARGAHLDCARFYGAGSGIGETQIHQQDNSCDPAGCESYLSRTQRNSDLGVFFEPSRMSFDGYLDLKVPLHQIPFIQRVPAMAATERNTLKLIRLLMSIRSD